MRWFICPAINDAKSPAARAVGGSSSAAAAGAIAGGSSGPGPHRRRRRDGSRSRDRKQKPRAMDRLAAAVLIRLRDIGVLKPLPLILHQMPCFLQERGGDGPFLLTQGR